MFYIAARFILQIVDYIQALLFIILYMRYGDIVMLLWQCTSEGRV